MWVWGGQQGADYAGLLGRLRAGSGREKESSSLVRNEKISFLEGQALLGIQTWHLKSGEGGRREISQGLALSDGQGRATLAWELNH